MTSAFNDIYDILLYFLFDYNLIHLVLFIFGFGFYKTKSLVIVEDTMFKVKYRYIL